MPVWRIRRRTGKLLLFVKLGGPWVGFHYRRTDEGDRFFDLGFLRVEYFTPGWTG